MRYLSLTLIVTLIAFYVQGQTSPHGNGFKIDCAQCHTSTNWKVNLKDIQFNHDNTGFKLAGQHKAVNCRECHLALSFKDPRRNCLDCHTDVHDQSLGKDCAKCHTPNSWIIANVTEMHQQTRFPLLGAHRSATCTDCHHSASRLKFEPLGIACVDCHKKDFQDTSDPNHVTGKYSTDCLECHSAGSESWHTGVINHDFFPLTGGHSVGCGLCHTGGTYKKIPTDCNSCHNKQFTASQTPKHVEAGIPVKCETCHNISGWKPSTFNHLTTGYELKGTHKSVVQCSDCHKGNLTNAPQTCVGCHQVQYNTAPNHKAQAFPTDCAKCHTQNNWIESSFNHTLTNFPLTGSHTKVQCTLCHKNGYAGTPTACNSCHMPVFASSQLPVHVSAGIPVTCANCHTTTAWKPSTFNHTTTGYELKGSHKNIVQCSQCHKGNVTSAPQACIGCHQVQYDTAPGHKQSSYSTDCTKCHSQDNWLAASFDHSTTNFPLTGAHTKVLCSLCHANGYVGTSKECKGCHMTVYTSSQLPGHVAAGIPVVCATCHNTAAWKPSVFSHTTTGYVLLGAHTGIAQCSSCHKGNVTTAPQTCIGCHQVQYNGASNHTAQSYPTDCIKCHTQANWLATNFNHATTIFPLTGAHTKVLCSLCHTNGYSGGTPTTCNSCHLQVYTSSQLPGHVAAGIPKDCATCHTTASWKPSSFNHASTGYLLVGAHTSIAQCSSCHKGNVTTAPQTCIGCHQVQYNSAPNHKAQSYPTDCIKCHTQTNWLATNFNHSSTVFPLTGAHTTVLCNLCHTNGYSGGTPTACYSCHTAKYNASTNPNHLAAKFPTNCEICHTTKAWTPSTYNHDAQYFPINSGKHSGKWTLCSECHNIASNYAIFSCIICHEHSNKTSVDSAHKSVKNYSYVSTACFNCHPQGRKN